jgi:hypothetical protein
MAVLQTHAQTEPLANHLQNGKYNARYMSPEIQNELSQEADYF